MNYCHRVYDLLRFVNNFVHLTEQNVKQGQAHGQNT